MKTTLVTWLCSSLQRIYPRSRPTVFEWSHLFSQWGVKRAPRLYHGQGSDARALWRELAPFRSFEDFPKSARALEATRARLLPVG